MFHHFLRVCNREDAILNVRNNFIINIVIVNSLQRKDKMGRSLRRVKRRKPKIIKRKHKKSHTKSKIPTIIEHQGHILSNKLESECVFSLEGLLQRRRNIWHAMPPGSAS